MAGAEERYRDAGMDGYLSKPLSPDTLAATLEAIVRGERREKPVPAVDEAAITGLRGFLDGAQFAAFIGNGYATWRNGSTVWVRGWRRVRSSKRHGRRTTWYQWPGTAEPAR